MCVCVCGGGGVELRDKMAIAAYILEIVKKNPFLRLQMRAKEDFMMQNETDRWSIFLVNTKYW